MASWWKRNLDLAGYVFYRGELCPRAEDFDFLGGSGVSLKQLDAPPGGWILELTHPEWGKARLLCMRDQPSPPREMFEYSFIPEADRQAARSCRTSVRLEMRGKHEHVLRDRKLMLRYLRAVMADDGVVAMDGMSGKVWTRDELDDELSHDADLDVAGILNIHAITDDGESTFWIHTHGLAEIGSYDFDVLDPSSSMLMAEELFRSVAFLLLEGAVGPSSSPFEVMHPGGVVKLVPMAEFLARTDAKRRESLAPSVDDGHRKGHLVLCEPGGSFFGSLLGRSTLQPVRFLTKELPEDPMLMFSTTASELMAERARGTYSMLRRLSDEFAEFGFPTLVKIGFKVDDAKVDTEREHMWFIVHELMDDAVDATLVNQPYGIARMKEGDRDRHPVSELSDWMIMTPAGSINPRSTAAVRVIRENPEKVREAMKDTASDD